VTTKLNKSRRTKQKSRKRKTKQTNWLYISKNIKNTQNSLK